MELDVGLPPTEISEEKGLRYGGIKYEEVLRKFEETDSADVAAVRGTDAFNVRDDEFNNYIRSEIVDWSPDPSFLEEDHARRDPAWSRSQLNIRYNGTRGTYPELPRHPEMFLSFTDLDP
ncbi:MAG: hypothetical protein KGL39_09260, partial [Patescibacteria group bacterium]|nr:hypothetical protein [Patescibacteria group bacterium]